MVPPSFFDELDSENTTDSKDSFWNMCSDSAEQIEVSNRELNHPKRTLVYVPTIILSDAKKAKRLFDEFNVTTVCDLGAGDFRFSRWCANHGFNVIAYELNNELINKINPSHRNLEIRKKDYYDDYDSLTGPETAVVAFGGTNELPHRPEAGLGIEGYFEKGISAYYNGSKVASW